MTNEVEIVLVGGSKDGTTTEGAMGLNSVQNIVLNEDFTGPEFVDRYVATGVKDREGREVYAHVGRYSAEESQSYWESLPQEQVEAFVEAEKAERAEEEATAAAEAEAAKEEKPDETISAEDVTEGSISADALTVGETGTQFTDTGSAAKVEPVATTQDAETGETNAEEKPAEETAETTSE